jgi:hypothetical protein
MTGDSASSAGPSSGGLGRHGAALLFLAVAVGACFPAALSPRWVFFARDIHGYWYPMVSTFLRAVGEGGLPTWDQYEAYGLPLWADPGAQVAYPPTWLNLVLLPHTVYKLILLGHVLAGGIGTYALARRWRMGALPAAAAGVTFACSGPLLSTGSLIHHLCGAAWIPWALWAFDGVLERGSRRAVGILALVLGAQALAGAAEACAMSGLAGLVRWAMLARGHLGPAVRRLPLLAAATGVAGLLAAVQWLPTVAIVHGTNRISFAAEAKLGWSVHPYTVVDVLVPRLFSEMSMGAGPRDVLYAGREPFLASLYLGVATLPLALLGLRSDRPQRGWVVAALGLFAALSLGSHFPPARMVLALPPLSLFRYPSKYMVAAALFWALLAGLGVEVWWRAWGERLRAYGRTVGLAVAGLTVALASAAQLVTMKPLLLLDAFQVEEPWRAWMTVLASRKLGTAAAWLGLAAALLLLRAFRPEWSRASGALMAVVVAADLTTANRSVNPLAPAELLAHRPPLLASLRGGDDTRLLSVGDARRFNQDLARGPAGWEPDWRWTLGMVEMVVPPSGTRWGLRGSYDGDFTGLASPRLPFMGVLVRQTDATPLGVRLLQLGNVGWVIDQRPEGFPLLAEVTRAASVFSRPLRLLRVPDPLPPCYVVGASTLEPDDEAAIRRIAVPEFDPRAEVVLAEGPPLGPAPAFRGTAAYRLRHASRLLIETDTNGPGVLVLSEAYDPGWRATVDGAPVAVLRANVLFRGVRLPPGRHLVEMTYRPRAIAWGLAAAGLGLVLVVFLVRPRAALS